MDDLRQVAALGLIEAIDHFDPDAGQAFTSYAVPTILGHLRRHFRDHGWAVHVPRGLQELQSEVDRTKQHLEQALGRSATAAEVAADIGTKTDRVVAAMAAGRSYRAAPLEEHRTVGSVAVEDPFAAVEARLVVRDVLRHLDRRTVELLRMRFVEQRSQSDIGARIGVSQVHVSRLLRRTLRELSSLVTPVA